jgi:hypothetical protein
MTPHFQELIERSVYEQLRVGLVRDGYTPDITLYPDTQAGYDQYVKDLSDIEKERGFAVELFNMSSNMDIGLKKVPRVVLSHNFLLPGPWGSSPEAMKQLNQGVYNLIQMDRVSVELFFNCSIIANSISQFRVLTSLLVTYLPTIQYVPYYTDGNNPENFLVTFQSAQDFSDTTTGILEKRYTYSIPDIIMNEIMLDETIVPIKQIKLNTYIVSELGLN